MAGLCEGGNEPPGSLKASKYVMHLHKGDVHNSGIYYKREVHRCGVTVSTSDRETSGPGSNPGWARASYLVEVSSEFSLNQFRANAVKGNITNEVVVQQKLLAETDKEARYCAPSANGGEVIFFKIEWNCGLINSAFFCMDFSGLLFLCLEPDCRVDNVGGCRAWWNGKHVNSPTGSFLRDAMDFFVHSETFLPQGFGNHGPDSIMSRVPQCLAERTGTQNVAKSFNFTDVTMTVVSSRDLPGIARSGQTLAVILRASLHSLLGRGSFLLNLALLLGGACFSEGSVRPASVANIREVLVWGSERDVQKEIKDGVLLPPLPNAGDFWSRSTNLIIEPDVNPKPGLSQVLLTPVVAVEVKAVRKDGDIPPMPYVDSSQFRRSNAKPEGSPAGSVPATKKFTGKLVEGVKIVPEKVKPEKLKVASKKQEVAVQSSTEDKPAAQHDENPPVWSHALLSDELSDPFGRLPSNEEYDRSSRFTHSILYGFDTGF
ncbi:hypothetical protein ANN_26112 [Periplaneta americana]|uniref:Uncharacterized protein n=1 Tax=Periplaneta americana TaxID=6978 RepID=A0ABQ8S5F8_PERAM|nr:hypothetical protein ANN_26112 [Periplaneta americana]